MSRTLAVHTTVDGVTYPAGSTPPADVAKQIDNPTAWGDTPEADDDVVESYGDMKVVDLKAEIEARNETRPDEDQLRVSGTKADLVAVLEADDADGA